MKWFGVLLTVGGALGALIAGFGFHNVAWTVGGIVFFFVGALIIVRS